MTGPALDHIVLAAESLDEGAAYVAQILGVEPSGGGEHTSMGTHNRLVRLGPDCYLEIIAVNPDAPLPDRPRWFELDTPAMREKLRHGPGVVTWALRTNRIDKVSANCAIQLGRIEGMARGDLHWRLTLADGGRLIESGLVPFLIQWEKTPHIASGMRESGCRLAGLTGYHPRPDTVTAVLRSLGAEHLLHLEAKESEPYLAVAIETPGGLKTLQ